VSVLAWMNGTAKVTATITQHGPNGSRTVTAVAYLPPQRVEALMLSTWQQMNDAALPAPAPTPVLTDGRK
jgi:hypothetical protein